MGLAVVWGWSLLLLGAVALLAFPLAVQASEDGYCENDDHPGACADAVELFGPPLTILGIGAATLVPARAWRRGREWGRWASAAVFALWSIGALAGAGALLRATHGVDEAAVAFWFGMAALWATVSAAAVRPVPTTERSSPPGGELAMGADQGRS